MRFRERLFRLLSGRYGMDELNKFLFWTYIILYVGLCIVDIFVSSPFIGIFYILLTALMIYLFYRMLSRSIYVRQSENRKFLKARNAVVEWFRLQRNKLRDCKTHVYRRCPNCKAVLRLKRVKGSHRAACPRCANRFDVHI